MIPRLYAAGTTTFVNEGLGALADCLSCETSTAINGLPELNLTYPVAGVHADEIGERCIIVADQDHAKAGQPYIVKEIDKSTPGTLRVYAVHLACDLLDGTGVEAFTADSLTNALLGLQSHATHANGVTLASDFTMTKDFNHAEPSSMKQALGGMEGSVLDTYGGEYDFSGLTATLRTRLGADNGVIIRWAKNLQKLDMQIDWSTVYTGIYPFWVSLEGNSIKQMATPVYSLGTFPFDRVLMLNVSSEFETEPTDAQLLTFCVNYEATHTLTSPKISWKVTMKELRNTPEYENVALLEQVALGDTVRIYLQLFGVNANARIVSERYDVLREQYNDLTIGSVRASLASTMVTQAKETQSAISNAETTLADAIKRATDAITGNVGGYIVTVLNAAGEPQELLILDDPDISQATKVWRWNLAGLGYSDTGYAGTYTTAITQDGEIVADFIKTGTLDASLVNVVNLIAQHVRATNGTRVMDISSGALTANNGADWRAWLETNSNNQGTLLVYGGTRPNLNGNAADPGNDSTSRMSYIDPNGIAIGLDKNALATGDIRTKTIHVENDGSITLKDASNVVRAAVYGSTGAIYLSDSAGVDRVKLYGSQGSGYFADSSGNNRFVIFGSDGSFKSLYANGNNSLTHDNTYGLQLFDGTRTRVWLYPDGTAYGRDSAGTDRWVLRGPSGNAQFYMASGQEAIGFYPAESQMSLYNSSGTRTVQIRGDGTASSAPLPVNQGGTGETTVFPKHRHVSGSVAAVYNDYVDIVSTSLPGNYNYIILATLDVNNSISVMGGRFQNVTVSRAVRTTGNSGGGATIWAYLSSSTTQNVTLQGYGYVNSTYNYRADMDIWQFPALSTSF